jgi:two-component sensor histidine kinase
VLRVGFFLGLLALIGIAISGLAAYRIYEQDMAIDRATLARSVDTHANLIQERLSQRELLARIAVSVFRPARESAARALEPLRSAIYAFRTDFVVTGWIARLTPPDFAAAEAGLRSAGFSNPVLRNYDGSALNRASVNNPVDVLMDVEPQNAETKVFPGRAFDTHPIIGPVLAEAMKSGKPIASDPIGLLQSDGPLGIVLAAPVAKDGSVVGFITFSYRLASLMLTNDALSPFAVALQDPRSADKELKVDAQGEVSDISQKASDDIQPILRKVAFGDREWTLNYYPRRDSEAHARDIAIIVAVVGLALTTIMCGLFGYVSYNNVRLSREIQTRIGFERRLTAVIDELNHRVKNILAVIQSIVTRTLRHGVDADAARDLLIGRIHAMSNVVTLLSESQWQGVKLRGLFESRAIPNADRIVVEGPDITVSARAAQSLSLLFFELASHSDEGLSLVGKHPHILAKWIIAGEGRDAVFDFRWEEFNTSAATRRPDGEFGIVLLDRVAPEALGGTSKRYFTDVSYVYELTAPMATVIDENEMGRTGRLAAPLQGKR